MLRINIHDAKTNLSRYLPRIEAGETILLCRRNVPIAEIRPIEPPRTEKRPIGLCKGEISIPPSFFDPLDEELLDLFEGKGP